MQSCHCCDYKEVHCYLKTMMGADWDSGLCNFEYQLICNNGEMLESKSHWIRASSKDKNYENQKIKQ